MKAMRLYRSFVVTCLGPFVFEKARKTAGETPTMTANLKQRDEQGVTLASELGLGTVHKTGPKCTPLSPFKPGGSMTLCLRRSAHAWAGGEAAVPSQSASSSAQRSLRAMRAGGRLRGWAEGARRAVPGLGAAVGRRRLRLLQRPPLHQALRARHSSPRYCRGHRPPIIRFPDRYFAGFPRLCALSTFADR